MGRAVVLISAIIVLIVGVLGVILPVINTVQAMTLFETGDPQLVSSAISEAIIGFLLGLPILIAQLVLAIWAIKQLRKIQINSVPESTGN